MGKMKQRSLKFKLIVGGVLAAIIPLMVVGLFSIMKSSNALVSLSKGQAKIIAQNLATMTNMAMEQEVQFARGLAPDPLVKNAVTKVAETGMDNSISELKNLDSFLTNIVKEVGADYNVLFVTDSKGLFISDSNGGANRAKKNICSRKRLFCISQRIWKNHDWLTRHIQNNGGANNRGGCAAENSFRPVCGDVRNLNEAGCVI
jgi:hypothetical protein